MTTASSTVRSRALFPSSAGHPRPGLLAAEDAELEGAAPGDAAEAGRELLVVLELQPVDEAVLVAVGVHRFEEFLAVELRQHVRAEPAAEGPVAGFQLRPRQELPVGGELLVVVQDSGLDPVVEHRRGTLE